MDMSQTLMGLSLGERYDHGFLTPFNKIKKREELPSRVFLLWGWSPEKVEPVITFRMSCSGKVKNKLKVTSLCILRDKLKIN